MLMDYEEKYADTIKKIEEQQWEDGVQKMFVMK